MEKQFLTPIQAQTLNFIKAFIASRGYAPSLAEIGAELCIVSRSGPHQHVSSLIRKGFLRRKSGVWRGLEVISEYAQNLSP